MTVAEQLIAKGELKKMQEVLIQFLTQKFGTVSEADEIGQAGPGARIDPQERIHRRDTAAPRLTTR